MLSVNAVEIFRIFEKDSIVAGGTLQAPEVLTVQKIREFGVELLGLLRAGVPLGIDLSMVQRIDTAGLQLLVLARREADRGGVSLHFVKPAPIVVETFQFCGLAAVLNAST